MRRSKQNPLTRALQAGVFIVLTLTLATSASASSDAVVAAEVDGAVKATLTSAFKAALAKDFDAYLKTVHPDERANKKQTDQIKRYAWSRFVRQAAWYVKDKNPASFVIAKSDGSDDAIRVFVKDVEHSSRMPVPVRLKKNPDGKSWGIVANSL